MKNKDLEQYLLRQINDKDELINSLIKQVEALNNTIGELTSKFETALKELTDNINYLTKQKFGIKSEKSSKVAVRNNISSPSEHKTTKKQKPAKRSFHGLEEHVVDLYPDGDVTLMKELRHEDIIKLKFIQARVVKIIYRRWSYVKDDQILTAAYPDGKM